MATFSEIMAENGYTCKTTFWTDFSIADQYCLDYFKDDDAQYYFDVTD